MDLRGLAREVYRETAPGVGEPDKFFGRDAEVRLAVSSFPGVKGSIKGHASNFNLDHVSLAATLCDFTSMYINSSSEETLAFQTERQDRPQRILFPQQVINESQLASRIRADGTMNGTYALRYSTGPDIVALVDALGPLAASGRIMFRPHPTALVFALSDREPASQDIKAFEVDPDSTSDPVTLAGPHSQASLPMQGGVTDPVYEMTEASFVLPFITGISFVDLAKVLDDEEHNLAELRASVASLIRSVRNRETTTHDVLNDVLRPAVGKVERRMRHIADLQRKKAGGAFFTTAALSLASLTIPGMVQLLTPLLTSLLGVGGAALFLKEYSDHMKARADAAEMPHHLLWRLNQMRMQG